MPVSVRSSTLYNPIIPLVTTIADCENTSTKTTVALATIPANTLAVGDIIVIEIFLQRRQNSGASINANQYVDLNDVTMQSVALSIASSASTFRVKSSQKCIVKSISAGVATLEGQYNASGVEGMRETSSFTAFGTTATQSATSAAWSNNTITVSISNTISLAVKWASANANAYIRVQQAQAYIIKKAV